MKFGIFYEHQLPRPWDDGDELKLFQDALDQVELADRLGIDYAWEVEHHFLEEYSHSSAPEVFLAACSQRTKNIRLGHGIMLMPPGYNHPARVAERIATLDLVSQRPRRVRHRRIERRASSSRASASTRRRSASMWREAIEQIANMLAMDPYPGFQGKYFSMPLPQRRAEAGAEAASAAVGGVLEPRHDPPRRAARHRRADLRLRRPGARRSTGSRTTTRPSRTSACRSATRSNPNVAMVTGFSCHEDARRRAGAASRASSFFGFALGHYYIFGTHEPGRTDVWEDVRGSQRA